MAKAVKTDGNARITLFAQTSTVKKLDFIARKKSFDTNEKVTRTDLVNEALADYIAKFEKRNGAITLK